MESDGERWWRVGVRHSCFFCPLPQGGKPTKGFFILHDFVQGNPSLWSRFWPSLSIYVFYGLHTINFCMLDMLFLEAMFWILSQFSTEGHQQEQSWEFCGAASSNAFWMLGLESWCPDWYELFSFKSQVIELTCQYSQMPVSCCDLLFLWLLYHDLNVDDGCLLPYFFLIEWKASGRSEPGLWQSRHWKCWQDLQPSSSQPIWRRGGRILFWFMKD